MTVTHVTDSLKEGAHDLASTGINHDVSGADGIVRDMAPNEVVRSLSFEIALARPAIVQACSSIT